MLMVVRTIKKAIEIVTLASTLLIAVDQLRKAVDGIKRKRAEGH